MKVEQIPGEPTRYYVESSSLECDRCKKTQSRRETNKRHLDEGDACPTCRQGVLKTRWHLVDLAAYRPIGQCSCEHFSYRLQANLSKISPSELYKMTQGEAARLRCTHIEAARALALDLTVNQHVKHEERLGKNPGRYGNGVGA
jgi:hypothetical protein